MFNQPEVDSYDQDIWRTERELLHLRVATFCNHHDIGFSQRSLHQYLRFTPHSKVVFMWLFDLISDWEHWQSVNELCERLGKKVFVVTDNVVEFGALSNVEFSCYHQFMGMTASYGPEVSQHQPSKLYNCFIQRVCSVRQSWFYFLHHHSLLDKGYVSLLMKQMHIYSSLTGRDLFDYIHYQFHLDQLPHFDAAYHAMKDQVPFRNFTETENLLPLIEDSRYSLVLETYATEDDGGRWFVSEKALRSLQFPNISLLFVQRHCLAKLQALGLQFDPHLEPIDNLAWQQRQQALLEILVKDSIDYDPDVLYNQCKHNRSLLQSWKSEYQRSSFFDDFFHKVLSV